MKFFQTAIFAFCLLLSARHEANAQNTPPVPVVASFSILGDFVRVVGGDRIALVTLVGPDIDAHDFQPRPSDAKTVGAAKLIIANGLGFEGWLDKLVKAAGYKGRVCHAAEKISATIPGKSGHGHAHGHSHAGKQAADPHAWQDVANVLIYIDQIRDCLISVDPAGATLYQANTAAYRGELEALDAEIRAALAAIPAAQRRAITSHDAFQYFARAYGVQFIAAAGVSSEAQPSAAQVAKLISQMKKEKLKALFVENMSSPRLIDQLARETGATPGGTLYADALSPADGPAATYLAMMRVNLATLIAGLKQN